MSEDLPLRETLEQLIERLDHLERVLQANTTRLHAVELRLGLDSTPRAAQQRRPTYERLKDERDERAPPPPPTTGTPQGRATEGDETRAPDVQAAASPYDAQPAQEGQAHAPGTSGAEAGAAYAGASAQSSDASRAAAGAPTKRRDLESVIGGSWFNWVGIIAVTFGVAFFLKLAFENEWIGPGARVALGAAGGLALLYVAERLRARGLRQYAYVLSGGGLLILYLSVYAAHGFYRLINQPVAFLLMAAVTTTAVLLAVRHDALAVAILGLVGGFMTPILLRTGTDNQLGLFTYIALLDAGVLAVAYFKRWRSLDFLSFAGTVLMTLGWAAIHYRREKLWTTLVFISIFFILYALLAVFHNVLTRRPSRWFDVALLAANATLYFGAAYALLYDAGYDHVAPASHALLVSTFFTCLFYTAWRWSREDRLLTYSYVGAAVVFFTTAVAIQLELQWVTIAWAIEALMLLWVGLRSGETAPRHAALAVFGAAIVHWFAWDMREFAYGVDASFTPLLNRRALSCAVLVGALAVAARLYKRAAAAAVPEEERGTATTFFALAGNALALTLLSLDVNDYFNARLGGAAGVAADVRGRTDNARLFSFTALWAFYGATALALGLLRRITLLRFGALLLLAAACSVAVFNSIFYAATWHVPVFNHTFMGYAALIFALAACARFYTRFGGADAGERAFALPAFVLAANIFALVALSVEAIGFFDRAAASLYAAAGDRGVDTARLEEGKAFTLSLIWTLYGACAFLYGARRNARAWRYGGLLLLAATSVKLLVWDAGFYASAWHAPVLNRTFAAFALLVAALWLVARTYARSGGIFEEGANLLAVVTVAANVLALVALSAEAAGYFQSRIAAEWSRVGPGVSPASPEFDARLRDLELAKQLSLSVMWALYGGGLLVAGRLRRVRLLRLMALALLSLTTLKVFFWDLSYLDRVYRIISFIVLGLILLAVSYLYQKSQQRAAEADEG